LRGGLECHRLAITQARKPRPMNAFDRGIRGGAVWGVVLAGLWLAIAPQRPCQAAAPPGCLDADSACEDFDFAGRWEGVVTIKAAEIELDFTVDLRREAGGSWSGRIDMPSMNIAVPLKTVAVRGANISFEHASEKGDVVFTGKLAGDSIRGDCKRTSGVYPFVVSRTKAAASVPVPPLEVLPGGAKDFATRFNQDRDKVRLLLLLSPT
jgi:hypothetical protein